MQIELTQVEEVFVKKTRLSNERNDVENKLLSILYDIIGVHRLQGDTIIASGIGKSASVLFKLEDILDKLFQIMISLENVITNVKGARNILKNLTVSLENDVTLSAVISSSIEQHENSSTMSQLHSYLCKANGNFELTIGLIRFCYPFAPNKFLYVKSQLECISHDQWKRDIDQIYIRGAWEKSSLSLQALKNDMLCINNLRIQELPHLISYFDNLKKEQEAKYRKSVEEVIAHRLIILETAFGVWKSLEIGLEQLQDKPRSQSPPPSFETDEISLPMYPDTDLSSILSSSLFSNEEIVNNLNCESEKEQIVSMDIVLQNLLRMSLIDEMPQSRRLFNRDLKSQESSVQMPDLENLSTLRPTWFEPNMDVKSPEPKIHKNDQSKSSFTNLHCPDFLKNVVSESTFSQPEIFHKSFASSLSSANTEEIPSPDFSKMRNLIS
ncbi:hypothetical protein HK096_009455 [Nowakowskiella sp. JEL0078]|nr:hypothetical protein HK096_009455 [Nowakowskiella sp. JEL0078]